MGIEVKIMKVQIGKPEPELELESDYCTSVIYEEKNTPMRVDGWPYYINVGYNKQPVQTTLKGKYWDADCPDEQVTG